jgi:hypothetical protein
LSETITVGGPLNKIHQTSKFNLHYSRGYVNNRLLVSFNFDFILFASTAEAIYGSVTMYRCHSFTEEMSGIRLNYTLQFTRNKITKICGVHLKKGGFSRRNFK